MARRKAPVLPIPAQDEAVAIAASYVAAEHEAARIRTEAAEAIADIERRRDAMLSDLLAPQKLRFAALRRWWDEGGGRALAGKRRSLSLAGAKIGLRLGTPKVVLTKGMKVEEVAAWLAQESFPLARTLVRVKTSLDKTGIARLFATDANDAEKAARARLTLAGVGMRQDEEFFIDAGDPPGSAEVVQGG